MHLSLFAPLVVVVQVLLPMSAQALDSFELWVPEQPDTSVPAVGQVHEIVDFTHSWSQKKRIQVKGNSFAFAQPVTEVWLKLQFPAQEQSQMLVLGAWNIQYAEMHHWHNGQEMEAGVGGPRVGTQGLNWLTRIPVFTIKGSLDRGQDEIYIRLTSLVTNDVHLDLQANPVVVQDMEMSRAIIYFFLGAVLMVMIYMLVLYSGIREKSIFYYLGFILSFALDILNDTGLFDYFTGSASGRLWSYYVPLCSCAVIFFALCFTLKFLELKGSAQKLLRSFFAIPATLVILSLAVLWQPERISGWAYPLMTQLQSFTTMMIVAVVAWAAAARMRYARLVLASWLPLGVFIILDVNRLLPLEKAYSKNYLFIPLFFEMLVMSIAMADKASDLSRKAEEAVRAKNQNTLLKQVLRAISHDLTNHFFIISSNAELLETCFPNSEISQRVTRIYSALRRANQVLTSARNWLMAKDERLDLNLQPLVVKNLMAESISLFTEKCLAKDIQMTLDWPDEIADEAVMADESALLNQVLNNALSNAIKFTARGGVIAITGMKMGEELVVSIRDPGMGMSRAVVDKINNGEFTASTLGTEKEKGTGFGMTLMATYMQTFGGTMRVRSQTEGVEKGTEVILTFKKIVAQQIALAA